MVEKLASCNRLQIFYELRSNDFMNFFGDEDLCEIVPRELSKIEKAIKNHGNPLIELNDFKQLDEVLVKYLDRGIDGESDMIYTYDQKRRYEKFIDWYNQKK